MEDLFAPFAGTDAARLAGGLIARFGGLASALGASPDSEELAQDEQEALRLVTAARKLVNVAMLEVLTGEEVDFSAPDLSRYLKLALAFSAEEKLLAIFVDDHNRYIRDEILGRGGCASVGVSVRHISRRALDLGARGVVLAHNHPSGSAAPSQQDWEVTRRAHNALSGLEVELLDHLIVTRKEIYSLRRRGAL